MGLTLFLFKMLNLKISLLMLYGMLPDYYILDAETMGPIWHKADFDNTSGYRNSYRLLYSNDSLIFVTYDHYLTFHEIELENII